MANNKMILVVCQMAVMYSGKQYKEKDIVEVDPATATALSSLGAVTLSECVAVDDADSSGVNSTVAKLNNKIEALQLEIADLEAVIAERDALIEKLSAEPGEAKTVEKKPKGKK